VPEMRVARPEREHRGARKRDWQAPAIEVSPASGDRAFAESLGAASEINLFGGRSRTGGYSQSHAECVQICRL
jgi:hypothetical protein